MSIKNYNKCKDCKYFDNKQGWDSLDEGACMRIGMNERIIADAKTNRFISFQNNSNPQFVHVGENFGCILFEDNQKIEQ